MASCRVWWTHAKQVQLRELTPLLDAHELTSLNQYQLPERREQFAIRAALARAALAMVLDCAAGQIVLDRTCIECGQPHGRPRLASPVGTAQVSVTHSGQLTGVAVTDHGRIGIDVEGICHYEDLEPMLTSILHPLEWRRFESIDGHARCMAFLRTWVRKEAVTKLLGTGLATDPRSVFLAASKDRAGQMALGDVNGYKGSIGVRDLDPSSGHVGALAVEIVDTTVVVDNGSSLLEHLL